MLSLLKEMENIASCSGKWRPLDCSVFSELLGALQGNQSWTVLWRHLVDVDQIELEYSELVTCEIP